MEKRQDYVVILMALAAFFGYQWYVTNDRLGQSQRTIELQQERIDTTGETIDKLRNFNGN
jgi:hypothetical protein